MLAQCFFCFFFYYASAPPRYLHSFPTRRSSDLLREPAGQPGLSQLGLHREPVSRLQLQGRGAEDRSEEHTSELQSPDHLVCRLLLEKKKQTTNHTPK